MPSCPVCSTFVKAKYKATPYHMCHGCDLWFQDPLPDVPIQEAIRSGMGDDERAINRSLAESILAWTKPGRMLDVGCGYPILARSFQDLGCESFGLDRQEVPLDETLDVGLFQGDFEHSHGHMTTALDPGKKFQIITFIHSFNYIKDPLAALRRARTLIEEDGIIHIRIPDHGVSGFEQHIGQHPYIWSLPAILELLVQAQDLFVVAGTGASEGAGQRDITLRPITKKPTLWCGMIVKNEERDLPKCLYTIKDVVDGITIIDTGSTDQTETAARTAWPQDKPFTYETYTGASKQDEAGDWKLWDFSKARNQFIDRIDAMPDVDYMIWMDADDTLLTPNNLKRALYMGEYEVFGIMIETEGLKWVHHRMWRNHMGIKFQGPIHEYPDHGGHHGITLTDSVIHHDAAPGIGENSNQRNLRILLEEFAQNPTSTRTAFYLANTHKDGGRFAEAIEVYKARIDLGPGFWDEWLFAYLYKARCERVIGNLDAANSTLLEALSKAPNWSEFWMELAYIAYQKAEWQKCIGYCMEAISYPPSHTELWREFNKYTDQPTRLLSFCHESLGDKVQALKWAEVAKQHIGGPDQEWDERVAILQGKPQSKKVAPQSDIVANFLKKTTKRVRRIALHRPGAIGDIVMTLNSCKLLRAKYPGYEIHYFCHPGIGEGLAPLFEAAGITAWHDFKTYPDYIGPNAKPDYEQIFNLIGYPLNDGYPEKPMKKHLLQYFAAECGLMERDELPQLQLQPQPRLIEGEYATIHPVPGWSAYKMWPLDRWEQVIEQFPEIKFVQIGADADYHLKGADCSFMGQPLMTSVQLIANAKMHVGVDSFTNHLTHIKWGDRQTPALILWGSTQYDAAGYPENTNISLGLECQPCYRESPHISNQPRGVCINPPGQTYDDPCHACMAGISVERVAAEVRRLWNQ